MHSEYTLQLSHNEYNKLLACYSCSNLAKYMYAFSVHVCAITCAILTKRVIRIYIGVGDIPTSNCGILATAVTTLASRTHGQAQYWTGMSAERVYGLDIHR